MVRKGLVLDPRIGDQIYLSGCRIMEGLASWSVKAQSNRCHGYDLKVLQSVEDEWCSEIYPSKGKAHFEMTFRKTLPCGLLQTRMICEVPGRVIIDELQAKELRWRHMIQQQMECSERALYFDKVTSLQGCIPKPCGCRGAFTW
jgi:hypothetical protein